MSEENKPEEDKTPGRISWNELMTRDLEGSKKFYGELFGWKIEDMPMPNGMTYSFASRADGVPAAGMVAMPEEAGEMPTAWGSYVTVANLADSLEKAKSLGANVVKDAIEVPMGKFAFIADPQGGVIGLWEFADAECP